MSQYPLNPKVQNHHDEELQSLLQKRTLSQQVFQLTLQCSRPGSSLPWHQMRQYLSPEGFHNYLKRTNLKFFHPARCTDDKPYKYICIFWTAQCWKVGCSYEPQCLHKWCETIYFKQKVLQVDMRKQQYKPLFFHYTNDSFANDSGINWENLIQSFDSVVSSSPGRHMIVIQGHRLFESEEVMKKSDYTVILTGTAPQKPSIEETTNPTRISGFVLFSHQITGQGTECKQADFED